MLHFWPERVKSIATELKYAWTESHGFWTKAINFPLWATAVLAISVVYIPLVMLLDLGYYLYHRFRK